MTIGRLAQITALLKLEDGIDRDSIRQIAAKLADLTRMQQVLTQLLSECAHTASDRPCPIIASLALK